MADAVDAATGLVGDLTPLEILGPERASHVLSELVNAPGRSYGQSFGGGPPLGWALALSEIEAERSHLSVDGSAVSLHSLLSPPSEARANQLEDVLQLPSRTLELSWEWAPYSGDRARKRLRRAQRHFWQKRYSAVSQMTGGGGMVDAAAATEADRIAAAGSELENNGVCLWRPVAVPGLARQGRSGHRTIPRRAAPDLRTGRREAHPRALLPAGRLLCAAARPAPPAATAEGVRIGGGGRRAGAAVRPVPRPSEEQAPRRAGDGGSGDPGADRLSLRPVRRLGCRPTR